MRQIPHSRIRFYLAAAFCGFLIHLFYWPFHIAEAQGPRFMRQLDPVALRSLQLAPLTRVDAHVTDPTTWQQPGRLMWEENDECVMVYKNFDAGWVCVGGGAATDGGDGGEDDDWTRLAGPPVLLHPKDGVDANVVIGRLDNPSDVKHEIFEDETVAPDAGFIDTEAVHLTQFECNGPDASTGLDGGAPTNPDFETVGPGAPETADDWIESPAAGSGTVTAVYATNLMGDGSGRCTAGQVCPITGTASFRFGETDSGSGDDQRVRWPEVDKTATATNTFDATGVTRLDYTYETVGEDGVSLWKFEVLIGGVVKDSFEFSTSGGPTTRQVDLTNAFGQPEFSGIVSVTFRFSYIADRYDPRTADDVQYQVVCRDVCANNFGTWPSCENLATGAVSPGIPCVNGPHVPECGAPSSTCLKNCSGAGTARCECPVAGTTHTNQCANIASNCTCQVLPSFTIDDIAVIVTTGEDCSDCEQVGKRSRVEWNPSGNLCASELIAMYAEAEHNSGDAYAGSLFNGLLSVARSTVGEAFIARMEGIRGRIELLGLNSDTVGDVLEVARAISAEADIGQNVGILAMYDVRAPVIADLGRVDSLYGLHIEPLGEVFGSQGSSPEGTYGIWSEHTGSHRVDGSFTVGQLGAAPTSTSGTRDGTMYYDTGLADFQCREGGAWKSMCGAGAGGVTGSGTATQVAFWSAATVLTSDPGLYWDNVSKHLGIGTITPTIGELQVHGRGFFVVDGTTESVDIVNEGAGEVAIGSNSTGASSNIDLVFRVLTSTGSERRFIMKAGGQVHLVPIAGDATTLADGDYWYNSSTTNFRCRKGATTYNLHCGDDPITGSGTATEVAYFDSSSTITSESNLFWDPTGDFLGIAQATPTAALHLGTQTTEGHIRMDGIAGDPGTPTPGDIWHNTTQQSIRVEEDVGTLGLVGLLCTNTADSAAVTNTVTETAFDQPTCNTLPANSLTVGKAVRLRAFGIYSSGTGNPDLTIRVKYGTVTLCEVESDVTNNSTDEHWSVECRFTVRTLGATGTVMAGGESIFNFKNGSSGVVLGNTGTSTIDTTAGTDMDVTAEWSAASASHTTTLQQYFLEVLD